MNLNTINPMNTMNTPDNDRFDALWTAFREQVKAARTALDAERIAAVWSDDKNRPGTLYIHRPNNLNNNKCAVDASVGSSASIKVNLTADELRKHAAHCMAAAEVIEENSATAEQAA